jgi:hypothetical protein
LPGIPERKFKGTFCGGGVAVEGARGVALFVAFPEPDSILNLNFFAARLEAAGGRLLRARNSAYADFFFGGAFFPLDPVLYWMWIDVVLVFYEKHY